MAFDRPPKGKLTPQGAAHGDAGKAMHVAALGGQLVEIIEHALDQMKIRGITEDDLWKTIKEPDKTGLPTEKGRLRVRRNKTVRVAIDVVYEALPDRLRVITAIKITRRIIERGGK
jgi:hypothetical protein